MRDLEYKKELKSLEERMTIALLGYKAGLWEWNTKDNSVYVSPQWKAMLGYADDELPDIMYEWKHWLHPDDYVDVLRSARKAINNKEERVQKIHRLKHKNGHWIWILSRAKLLYKEDGYVSFIGLHTDIQEQKELELKYLQQAQIVDQVHDIVVSTDLQGYITSWNRGATCLLGYTKEEILGKHITLLYLEEDYFNIEASMRILHHHKEFHIETKLLKKDNSTIYVDLSLSLLKGIDDELTGFVGYAQDITKRKKVEFQLEEQRKRLDYLAYHDPLTNLPNRLYFQDALQRLLSKSKRHHEKFAVVFIDLDYFKDINDSFGHKVGDDVLRQVTQLFLQRVRKEDILARLGGDEFALLLENIKSEQDVAICAKNLLEVLKKPIEVGEHSFFLSCSIGISLYPDDATNMKTLLQYADAAMYKSKQTGRAAYTFYEDEMTSAVFKRMVLETELRHALDAQELIVFYQTKMDAMKDSLVGIEALVRWKHPKLGYLAPDEFLPFAKTNGLIVALDRYVIQKALEQFSQWKKKGYTLGVLAFNIERQQLLQTDFVAFIQKVLQQNSINPCEIEFEIAESILMQKPQELETVLEDISALGIQITIDNFGTAYTSLLHLKKLPISKLKIDKSLMKKLTDDEDSTLITKSMILLAKSLHLDVLAEGVETEQQKEFLLDNGCDEIQGFIYTQPMTAQKMEDTFLK